MLLTLAGFSFQYEWLRTGGRRALFVGCGALGLNLLTRLTTGLDLMLSGVFLLLVLWFEGERGRELWHRFVAYSKVAAPVYGFFLLVDRLYQFYRFGSFTNTYVSLFAKEHRFAGPHAAGEFSRTSPFHEGFFGAPVCRRSRLFFFSILCWCWPFCCCFCCGIGCRPEVRAYALTSWLLLLGYISFYARYTYWAGDFAWGDRYVSTAAQMAGKVRCLPCPCWCVIGPT